MTKQLWIVLVVAACGGGGGGDAMIDASVDPTHDGGSSMDAGAKTCAGMLADVDDPETGCGQASCAECPLPIGAERTSCTAARCDFECRAGLTKTATGCGPATSQLVTRTSTGSSGLTCAITPRRKVKCWGYFNGVSDFQWDERVPTLIEGLDDVRAISAGSSHYCALTNAGVVSCWGRNQAGELGAELPEDTMTPVVVNLPMPATAISAGGGYSCAVLQDKDVWCWGGNGTGTLGRTTATIKYNARGPITYANANAVQVSASLWHTCALQEGGTILCWGANGSGEVGTQQKSATSLPVQVVGISDATAVVASGTGGFLGTNITGGYTFAIRAGGSVYGWGFRSRLLGFGAPNNTDPVLVPKRLETLPPTAEIAAGPETTCMLSTAGGVTCWGQAGYGRLGETGLATVNNFVLTPTAIPEFGSNIRHVATASEFTCLVYDTDVRCAGANSIGQLATGTTSVYSSTPLPIANWSFDE